MERRCQEIQITGNYTAMGDTCSGIMGYITSVSGNVFPYDNRIFGADWDLIENPVEQYFTISGQVDKILEIIHVSDSTKRPIFEMNSGRVGEAFAPD